MEYGIESLTGRKIGFALDAAVLKQRVIAMNIANINSENYVPMRVNFASHLEQMESVMSGTLNLREQERTTELRLEPVLDRLGKPAKLELDEEVAAMAHNSMQYQALLKGLNRHYAVLNTAVNEGRK